MNAITCEAQKVTETPEITKTQQQARIACNQVMKDPLASEVIVDKYLLCDKAGMYHEWIPEQMWDRLANAAAKPEQSDKRDEVTHRFRSLLQDFKFVPGGRVLYGLGNPFVDVTLKNCYVVGIQDDSIEGIFKAAWQMAETYKGGGGCGIDISPLRPKGSKVHNAARVASGAVSFMDFFSHVTGMIGQKGRIGALMICIDVSHPDVEDFIDIKGGDLDKVRYANVSVKVTDEFMRAVKNDTDFDLRWGGKVYKTIKARQLWDKLIYRAWSRAEPGLLFWDTACRNVPAHNYPGFECIACNPCGEIFLSHGDSCNLGSVVLSKYVINPFTDKAEIDFDNLRSDVTASVRFLDNIISLEKSPMEFQQWANDHGRRLGLGIMGLADMLLKLGIKYDSQQGVDIVEEVMSNFRDASYEASIDLAQEKGAFPDYNHRRHMKSEFVQGLPDRIKGKLAKHGIRNISLNAIAPTGSISLLAGCSSGIEPVFMYKHIRKTNLGTAKKVKEHEVFHHALREWLEFSGASTEDRLPDHFVSAHDIHPEYRIKMQGTIQKYIDQSISNTVNLAKESTQQQVAYYYEQAWEAGCKGITVYRDGSREGVLSSIDADKQSNGIKRTKAPHRPDKLKADVHVIKPNGRSYTVFVGLLDQRPYEVFALDHQMAGLPDGSKGEIVRVKQGPDSDNVYDFVRGALVVRMLNRYEDQEASLITRLLSTSLRHGVPLEFLMDQMVKSKVPVTSFAKAIARALASYIRPEEAKGCFKCPECKGREIKLEGTCMSCIDCGWSRCT